jgi:hypothetical protein
MAGRHELFEYWNSSPFSRKITGRNSEIFAELGKFEIE